MHLRSAAMHFVTEWIIPDGVDCALRNQVSKLSAMGQSIKRRKWCRCQAKPANAEVARLFPPKQIDCRWPFGVFCLLSHDFVDKFIDKTRPHHCRSLTPSSGSLVKLLLIEVNRLLIDDPSTTFNDDILFGLLRLFACLEPFFLALWSSKAIELSS